MNLIMRTMLVSRLFCFAALLCTSEMLFAQGTTFMYQGRLNDGGTPANGNYDLTFSLYDATTNGNLIGGPLTNAAVPVSGGLFATNIDFGPVFTGVNYWLSIGVRTNGSTNAFTVLSPRQPLLPVPYAIFANTASNLLGTLTATQLVGTLPASAFAGYTNTVAFTNGANLFSGGFNGTFSGNGLNLTNLNGSAIAVGTVADARLSSNVPLLNANQTFTGANTFTGTGTYIGANSFTNWGNNFTGSFFGNGLVGWIVETGTSVAATVDAGFVLTASNLTTVTLPTPLHIGDIVRISGAGPGGWTIAQASGISIVGNFLSYANSSWLPSDATSAGWIAMASSADGSHMAAAADSSSVIYTSTDYGQSWSSSSSVSAVWRCVASSSDGAQLIAGQGSNGSIYYSTNAGANWTGATIPKTANWYSMAMSANGSNAVAVAYGGGIYVSYNGGANWQLSTNTTLNWWSVASSSSGEYLAAAVYGGQIYTSSDFGTNWVATAAPAANWTGVASSADGSKLAAVAYHGYVYTSSDYGAVWSQQPGATATNWEDIASSSDGGKLAAVSYQQGIYLSDNFGVTWTPQNVGTNNWAAICSSADGSRLAAGINVGPIYYSSATQQTMTSSGTNGRISGAQGSAVELQYIGNNQWMPVSSTGTIWAN